VEDIAVNCVQQQRSRKQKPLQPEDSTGLRGLRSSVHFENEN